MVKFIKKLFCREEPLPFDTEKAIGYYLLNLPVCTSNVVVTSPRYGDQYYRCEVIVDANGLLPWAEHYAHSTCNSNQEIQAALQALPLWLRGANKYDPTLSYLPPFFVMLLRPYILDFINEGVAQIVCPDCMQIIEDIDMKKLDERRSGPWVRWTDEWYCPRGHLLYQEEHELHLSLRK